MGQKEVNDRIIRLISVAFGVNEQWLKTGEGAMFQDPQNPKVEEIIRIFKNLNPFFQDLFLDQLRRIYDYERGKQ